MKSSVLVIILVYSYTSSTKMHVYFMCIEMCSVKELPHCGVWTKNKRNGDVMSPKSSSLIRFHYFVLNHDLTSK